jgi:PAS domain S-box-containing protein
VTAAELVRNFAECRETAAKQDLFVTHHGRATHVLVGIEQYHSLKAAAEQARAELGPEDSAHLLRTLAEWLDEAVILCDAEMKILFVNRVTQAVCRRTAQELVGQSLLDALPQTAGSLLEIHARRTVIGSELSSADIPSPFQKEAWLRFQSFPLGNLNVLMFRDITDNVQRRRLADFKEAILAAMSLHGEIAYVGLSVRGTVERVNEPSCKLIGLSEERLKGIAVADVVATADREPFRDALEDVIRTSESRCLGVRILTAEGDLAAVRIALVPIQGAFGAEGAVMLATPEPAR